MRDQDGSYFCPVHSSGMLAGDPVEIICEGPCDRGPCERWVWRKLPGMGDVGRVGLLISFQSKGKAEGPIEGCF